MKKVWYTREGRFHKNMPTSKEAPSHLLKMSTTDAPRQANAFFLYGASTKCSQLCTCVSVVFYTRNFDSEQRLERNWH